MAADQQSFKLLIQSFISAFARCAAVTGSLPAQREKMGQ